jgi:hypothetical protein
MPFIFGFLLGQTLASKDGFLAILLMPFAALFVFGVGYLGFYAGTWYEAGATASLESITWNPWTWHWQGVNLAHQFFDFFVKSFSELTASNLGSPESAITLGLNLIFKWMMNTTGAMVAISINLFVATIPLYAIRFAKFAYEFVTTHKQLKLKASEEN